MFNVIYIQKKYVRHTFLGCSKFVTQNCKKNVQKMSFFANILKQVNTDNDYSLFLLTKPNISMINSPSPCLS